MNGSGDESLPAWGVDSEIRRSFRVSCRRTLEKSIYVRMTARETQAYDEKCKELRKLTYELEQAVQLAHRTPHAQGAGISPPDDSPPSIPLKPPKDEA